MRIEELKLSKEEMLEVLSAIEDLLKEKLEKSEPEKWWDGFYIKEQVEKRRKALKSGAVENSLSDHIRAMIYAMLSSQTEWAKVEKLLPEFETIFSGYDPDKLKLEDPETLNRKIKDVKCGSNRRVFQMRALRYNIEILEEIAAKGDGTINAYYESCIGSTEGEHPYAELLRQLGVKGKYKLQEMSVSLVSEYLRNLGHNFIKPDTHLVRILGEGGLDVLTRGTSVEKQKWEAIEVIRCYAEELGKTEAGARFGEEVYIDYLLWAFCANKYGERCTKKDPKCEGCPIRDYCNKGKLHN